MTTTIVGNSSLAGLAGVHPGGGHQHVSSVAVSDDFNRGNSTGLGSNWAAPTGGTQLDVVSNEARAAVAGVLLSYWSANAFNANHYSEVQYPANFNGNLWRGPAVRMQAGARSCYLVEIVITLDEYDAFVSSSDVLGGIVRIPDDASTGCDSYRAGGNGNPKAIVARDVGVLPSAVAVAGPVVEP